MAGPPPDPSDRPAERGAAGRPGHLPGGTSHPTGGWSPTAPRRDDQLSAGPLVARRAAEEDRPQRDGRSSSADLGSAPRLGSAHGLAVESTTAHLVHHDDLRRDVGARRGHRLGQPGPGLPGQRRPRLHARGRPAGHRRRRQPVPAGPRHRPAAAGRRGARPPPPGARLRPGHRGARHHRARPRRSPRPSRRTSTRATRSSRSNPSTTRTRPRSTSPAGCASGSALFGPDFRLDHAELAAAFGPRTKLVLINSPHNPTGVVLGDDDLAAIARLAVEHDVLVVTDEVYEHLVFEGSTHRSLATFPGMRERTIRISSAGKTFSATGWKIGWAMGPGRADRRGDGGQAVPHLRLGRPVPARRRPRARRGRRLGRGVGARPAGPARPARRRACARSGSTRSSRRAPTS